MHKIGFVTQKNFTSLGGYFLGKTVDARVLISISNLNVSSRLDQNGWNG
jgi:hypothetical protein